MSSGQDSSRLVFNGESGAECEEFIYEVKQRALAAGKQRDPDWIADYASACFKGNALRWLETLGDDIQGDWSKLRRAMLEKYQGGVELEGASDVQVNLATSIVPTPAAAQAIPAPAPSPGSSSLSLLPGTPPWISTAPSPDHRRPPPPPPPLRNASSPAPVSRNGVLQLTDENGLITPRYLSKRLDGTRFTYTTALADALRVKIEPPPMPTGPVIRLSGYLTCLALLNLDRPYEFLGVLWHNLRDDQLSKDTTYWACLVPANGRVPGHIKTIKTTGAIQSCVWMLDPQNNVSLRWQPFGQFGFWPLTLALSGENKVFAVTSRTLEGSHQFTVFGLRFVPDY